MECSVVILNISKLYLAVSKLIEMHICILVSKYNLSFVYTNVYLNMYKVMLIINIIISGKIEEWGFVLN